MKHLLVAIALLGFVALPLSNRANAGHGPAPKVQVCHLHSANPEVVTYEFEGALWTVLLGTIVEIPENALPAHLAHGDSAEFIAWDEPGYPAAAGAIILEIVPIDNPPDPGTGDGGDGGPPPPPPEAGGF